MTYDATNATLLLGGPAGRAKTTPAGRAGSAMGVVDSATDF